MSRRHSTNFAINSGSTFAFFPRLPAEIRLMIWKHALPGPRVLEAIFDRIYKRDGYKLKVDQPFPTFLLFVCHESRSLVLETYTTNRYQNAYTDWNIDTLRMPLLEWVHRSEHVFEKIQKCRWGKSVKHLVLDCEYQTDYICEAVRYLLRPKGATPTLKTVTFEIDLDEEPVYAQCRDCSQVVRELLEDKSTSNLLEFADESYRVILEKSKDVNPDIAGPYSHFMKWINWFLVEGGRREKLSGVLFTLVKSKD